MVPHGLDGRRIAFPTGGADVLVRIMTPTGVLGIYLLWFNEASRFKSLSIL